MQKTKVTLAQSTAALVKVMNPSCKALDHIKLPVKRRTYTRSSPKNVMAEKKFEEEVIWYLRNRDCIVSKSGEMSTYHSHYIMSGMPDLFLFTPHKLQIAFVEVKTETGIWSKSQQDFKKICDAYKIIYILCRKIKDLEPLL